jgi:hypothetical protein
MPVKASQSLVVKRMQRFADKWERQSDQRAIFIRCYQLMTQNIIAALAHGDFQDSVWVGRLMKHFADYYFIALKRYDQDPKTAPPVWRLAFDTARDPTTVVFQHLLLGVNAHINYDLVLTLDDLLVSNWIKLSESQRQIRHADYDLVNKVIGDTIDAVQSQIVERAIPGMWLVDKAMGPVDEWLVSHLITRWRDSVWQKAIELIETQAQRKRATLVRQVEAVTLKRGQAILLRRGWSALRDLV